MAPDNSRRAFFKGLLGEAAARARDLHETLGPMSPLNRLDVPGGFGAPTAPVDDVADDDFGVAAVARPPRARAASRCAGVDELLALAEEAGLGARAADVRRLARHRVHLTPVEPSQPAAPGASRLGGTPPLPASVEWPSWQGAPLDFLLAVELAEAALPGGDAPLPPAGSLLVFHDLVGAPTGLRPDERGATQVVFVEPAEAAAEPSDDALAMPAGCAVELAGELVLPRVWTEAVQALDLDDAEHDVWEPLRNRLAAAQGAESPHALTAPLLAHHLLGYPDETMGDMPLACELLAGGHDVSDGFPHAHPLATELEARSGRWQLLLQLSVDEHLGWPTDAPDGRLYLWIDGDALRRRDFTQVVAIAR